MPEIDEERHEKEYISLFAIFQRLMDLREDDDARLETVEELMALRAEYAIRHACDGFNLTFDEALALLQKTDNLSELDATRRDILIAAVDNLVDFSVAEEYQMLLDIPDDEGDDDDEEEIKIFRTYNHRYAKIENADVEYAMIVAAALATVRRNAILTYMTQGDERVRPWHRAYEGFSAPKSSFPHWLVPPIEHMCRCYLIEDDVYDSVQAAANPKNLKMPDWFNPTFKESVAFGGRIFSDEHPYFQIDPAHVGKLQEIADRIKARYLNATFS